MGCSPSQAAKPGYTQDSGIRAERWEQSASSLDPQEQNNAFPHPVQIHPISSICQVELVALMAASENCAGVATDAVSVLGISTLCSGQAKCRRWRTGHFKVRDNK